MLRFEPRSYGYSIVRPIGKFDHGDKLLSRPRKFELVEDRLPCHFDREFMVRNIEKYNAQAIRRGWSTWAILQHDPEHTAFLRRAHNAEVNANSYGPGPRLCVSGYRHLDGSPYLRGELTVHLEGSPENVRAEILAALRGAIKEIELEQRQLKLHKPARRKAVSA